MSGPLVSADCACNAAARNGALPATAEEAFKNERLEISEGVAMGSCCMVWPTVGVASPHGREKQRVGDAHRNISGRSPRPSPLNGEKVAEGRMRGGNTHDSDSRKRLQYRRRRHHPSP